MFIERVVSGILYGEDVMKTMALELSQQGRQTCTTGNAFITISLPNNCMKTESRIKNGNNMNRVKIGISWGKVSVHCMTIILTMIMPQAYVYFSLYFRHV